MKLITLALAFFTFTTASMITTHSAVADETVKSKAQEMGNDTKRGAKKAVREVKDKTCEMVNGKMECAMQKTKHTIQNGADNVEDAID